MSDVESIILASIIAACAAELLTGFLDLGKNRIHFRFQAGYGARTWRYWPILRFLDFTNISKRSTFTDSNSY